MKQKTKDTIKRNTANLFGAFGYLFCLLQWVWAAMLYLSVIKALSLLTSFDTSKPADPTPALTLALPGPLAWIIVIVVTIFMVVLTIYAFIKMPMNIAKTSNEIVHKTAETVAPVIIKAQHKKVTKTSRIKLTLKLILVIKLLIIVIPVALTIASGLLDKQYIDYSIATIVGYGLAFLSVGSFVLQYLLSRLLRVKIQQLW